MDHLTAIDAAGRADDATFTLDALGRFRTWVVNGATTTNSIVSPSGDRRGVRVETTLHWFLPDPHGNVAGSLDPTEATVSNAIGYDAFGQTIPRAPPVGWWSKRRHGGTRAGSMSAGLGSRPRCMT